MGKASPEMQELARRLVALEATRGVAPNARTGVALRVIEKLRLRLVKLAGLHGFHSLLSRALTLARAEAPALETVCITADGFLERYDEDEPEREAAEAVGQDATVLVAHLLELLVTFIGESLTLQMMRDAWPEAAMPQASLPQASLNGADLKGEET